MPDLRSDLLAVISDADYRTTDVELTDALLVAIGNHDAAEITRLRERLRAAEAVCVMYGISPARHETEREKAAYEVWLTWSELVGPDATTAHPDLTDERITELARQRDTKRAETLARIKEGAS